MFLDILEYVEAKRFSSRKPTNSIIALQNDDFKLAEEIMVMSILKNGPAPAQLYPTSPSSIISNQNLSIEDIPEQGYKAVELCSPI